MLEFPSGQEKRDLKAQKEGVLACVVYQMPENSTVYSFSLVGQEDIPFIKAIRNALMRRQELY